MYTGTPGIFIKLFFYYTKSFKGIVSWDIDGLFMILSYSLDVGPLPLGILFILILCFHILIFILMLAWHRSKLHQLFRKSWRSLAKLCGFSWILSQSRSLPGINSCDFGKYVNKACVSSKNVWLNKDRLLFRYGRFIQSAPSSPEKLA
jgi:hypothetical protein